MIATLQLAVLYLAPAAILGLLLCTGRYPGERLILRLAARRRHRQRRRPLAIIAVSTHRSRIAGGRLLARKLASRGPPVVVVP